MGCASSQPQVDPDHGVGDGKRPQPSVQPNPQATVSRASTASSLKTQPTANDANSKRSTQEEAFADDPASPKVAQGQGTKHKGRRAAAGSEAVRDQIRKLAVGGPQSKEEKANVYEVADSDDEDLALEEQGPGSVHVVPKDPAVLDFICQALRKSFVFTGIKDDLLREVVERMYSTAFGAGSVVLQQGAIPKPDDCMYFLESGEVDVVISGGGADSGKARADDGARVVEGHVVRITQKPGWLFGDIALLFNTPRTASVVAKSDIKVWALDRRTFLTFVMKHAEGARMLRFARKVPLLKGLSDNELISVAKRMPERTYRPGEALIQYGERGDELYLIRYGKVRVVVPDGKGGGIEVAVLGRGQFVGERAVINDRLRSADCVADGDVRVVVLRKRDFLDLDNPLLAWMMDYDAVAAVLKALPHFQKLKQEQMEQVLDRFEERQELPQGHVILKEAEPIDRLYVLKMGEVTLSKGGQPASDPDFVREAGGFTFFGHGCVGSIQRSAYTVAVKTDVAHMLCIARRQLDVFLGAAGAGVGRDALVKALQRCPALEALSPEDLAKLADGLAPVRCEPAELVANAGGGAGTAYLVTSGELLQLAPGAVLPASGPVDLAAVGDSLLAGRLAAGDIMHESAVAGSGSLQVSLVAGPAGASVVQVTAAAVEAVLKRPLGKSAPPAAAPRRTSPPLRMKDLELHRVVGTGQFGLVRLVRHIPTGEVYALKVMHKAPIMESKQIEHVINERLILEEAAAHPFCVSLVGAYQDKTSLHLLQEWVPGGELFHHLDLEGAFDEPTACFYAANVLLALEYLHSRGIVYRDLKPENLLLDTQGYIKMADFGFAKKITGDKTFTICGTPDYQAPEVIMRRGTTKAADYWGLGVLIFEMLVGDPPFKSLTGDPWDTFRRTLSGRFYVPNFISDPAADLIYKLLQVSPEKRLGSGPLGAAEIKSHRWFSRIDWAALEQRRIPAPIRPRVRSPLDTSNFDIFDNVDEAPGLPRADKQPSWEQWDWLHE